MFSIIKSGMSSAMHELSVISNNISNANSNGFKKSLVAFSDFAGGLLLMQLTVILMGWVPLLMKLELVMVRELFYRQKHY